MHIMAFRNVSSFNLFELSKIIRLDVCRMAMKLSVV
jgi:hypothetical protein